MTLGSQAINAPAPIFIQKITEAVVQSVGTTLPEFYLLRHDSIASPEIRKRNLSMAYLLLKRLELIHQKGARSQNAALLRRQGCQLAFLGPGL